MKKINFRPRIRDKIATIIIDRKKLSIKEPIVFKIDPKRMLSGMAFSIIAFIIFITICAVALPSFTFLYWVVFIFFLFLYQELPILRYTKPDKSYLILDGEGIVYKKTIYYWTDIERIEFLKDVSGEGCDYIKIIFAEQKSEYIPFLSEHFNYDFTQLAYHIESKTEGLTFSVT